MGGTVDEGSGSLGGLGYTSQRKRKRLRVVRVWRPYTTRSHGRPVRQDLASHCDVLLTRKAIPVIGTTALLSRMARCVSLEQSSLTQWICLLTALRSTKCSNSGEGLASDSIGFSLSSSSTNEEPANKTNYYYQGNKPGYHASKEQFVVPDESTRRGR